MAPKNILGRRKMQELPTRIRRGVMGTMEGNSKKIGRITNSANELERRIGKNDLCDQVVLTAIMLY